jgi:hypothetical protein
VSGFQWVKDEARTFRQGMKDIARVAQLSAEEALRLLSNEHKDEENTLWLRFETELTRRLNGE